MNQFEYLFGNNIPCSIQEKLDTSRLFLFGELPEAMDTGFMEKDVFYPDGTPIHYRQDIVYPCYTGWYLKTPISSPHLAVTQGYSRSASVAAIMWMRALLPNVVSPMPKHFNGETITLTVDNENLTFCVPDTSVTVQHPGTDRTETFPIIPIADVMDNKDEWEDGSIPLHIEQQALLTLWLHQISYELNHRSSSPQLAYVVRITGNTAGDIDIRTIKANPRKLNIMLARLSKAFSKARTAGTDPLANLQMIEKKNWLVARQDEQDGAYQLNDDDFRDTLSAYMCLRSDRKAKEAELERVSEEAEAVAIELASYLSIDAASGYIVKGDRQYTVNHVRRADKNVPTISASLVNQFYPELNDVIHTSITPRGKVVIDVI